MKWIRDEYQFQYETDAVNNEGDLQRHRPKRDENTIQINPNDLKSSENGDTWYTNYRNIECQQENNSDKSFCKGFHSKESEQIGNNSNMQRQPEFSSHFDELQSDNSKWNSKMLKDDEKVNAISEGNNGNKLFNRILLYGSVTY